MTIKRGGIYFATYNEMLYDIMRQNRIVIDSTNKGRLTLKVHTEAEYYRFYFYDLAFACYHGYITSVEDMIPQMKSFRDYKEKHNFEIDHIDTNVYNNTVLNLSLMDKALNSSKGAITNKFVGPYRLTAVFSEGTYRILLRIGSLARDIDPCQRSSGTTLLLREGTGMIRVVCSKAKDFVACLRFLANTRYDLAKEACTPMEYYRKHCAGQTLKIDIEASICAQEALLAFPPSDFEEWRRQGD